MKTRRTRIALLLSLCLVIASLVTVLIVSAETETDFVTVKYANGTTETYAEGEEIVPIAVPADFARYDDEGDAYKFVVKENAEWRFTLNGKALTDMAVTEAMLGKTVYADVDGAFEGEKLFFTVQEKIVDITVPEEMRGEFTVYGYDEQSLTKYLSRDNVGDGSMAEPRYRYLRQRDNRFYITLYQDMYPTKFDPRWGSANKDWELSWQGTIYKVQDRTWRYGIDEQRFTEDGAPNPVGTSAKVYFNLNGHKVEIGASESFHFGSMAMTPYSMRLYIYSTEPGAIFSGAKSEAVFYSDDDTTITVGELDGETRQYGQNLSVYGKRVTHVNYGGGVYLYGGRYYQVGATDAFLNISHRTYAVQNSEFYVADQTEAALFFNHGNKSSWSYAGTSAANNNLMISNCIFYVGQNGTQLIKEVSSQGSKDLADVKPPEEISSKYLLRFENCEFYGVPTQKQSCYMTFSYLGETIYSVGTDENYGTFAAPVYISYIKNPTKTRTLYDSIGKPFEVVASCALMPTSEVAGVEYQGTITYWQPGVTPFVYDRTVITDAEKYVQSEGRYLGIPATLKAGQVYTATGITYGKKTPIAFTFTLDSGIEGFGLAGANATETGINFAEKVGNLSDIKVVLLDDIVLSTNVDFGTKGEVLLDLNGYKITIAADTNAVGATHRAGDGLELYVYSSKSGAVYENLSSLPIFSLSHGGKGGLIEVGDYTYALNSTYDGQNISFTSAGSFFIGNPMGENVEASAIFRAKNVNLIYTGDGVAFIGANDISVDRARIVMQPKNANATPIAIATRSDSDAAVGCSNASFYAPEGVNAIAYACIDGKGAFVDSTDHVQRVSYNNVAFYNVAASVVSSVSGVELSYVGNTAFDTLDALRNFYEGAFPQDRLLVRGSSQFYLNGKLQYIPLWQCAMANQVATVTFNSGKANNGSFTEDWVKGAIACHESFVVDGIFVYSYGTREVGSTSNILTAGCLNLVPGALRVNLTLEGELKLNVWVPMDSPITSLKVGGTKVDIATTLDYKDGHYLVQIPLSNAQLLSAVGLEIQTANYRETLTLPLNAYVAGLLANENVSTEEKYALYALVAVAEKAENKKINLTAPIGYESKKADLAEAPELSGNISSIAFDIMKNGTVLVVSGTAGTPITIVLADGSRIEGKLEGGSYRLTDVPAYLLLGDITVECGGESYVYSIGAYKQSLGENYRDRADALYAYVYYVAQMHAASAGA